MPSPHEAGIKNALTKYLLDWVDNYRTLHDGMTLEDTKRLTILRNAIASCNPDIIDCIVDDIIDCADDFSEGLFNDKLRGIQL